jgi:hypothetical protein
MGNGRIKGRINMGSFNIDMVLDGKLTERQVLTKIEEQRKDDRGRNGHQDGYSGDWQTIPGVDFHGNKEFFNINEASDYCLAHAEKWGNAIAVKVRLANTQKLKESKKFKSLQEKLNKISVELRDAERIEVKFKGKFVTCLKCKSKLATEFMKNAYSCRLCGQDLRPAKHLAKLEKIKGKLAALKAQSDEMVKAEAVKGEAKWYVAGWAAE